MATALVLLQHIYKHALDDEKGANRAQGMKREQKKSMTDFFFFLSLQRVGHGLKIKNKMVCKALKSTCSKMIGLGPLNSKGK